MADQAEPLQNVKVVLSENLDKLRQASTEYFQMLEKGLNSSHLPAATNAKQYCDYMRRNVMGTFDLCDKMIRAKDLQESMKMQSEFFQAQMRAMTDQARSMGESAMKAMTGAFTPKS